MPSTLENLKATGTLIVADTGDVDKIKQLCPQDATTNPSIIFAAAKLPAYKSLVTEAVAYAKAHQPTPGPAQMSLCLDKVAVNFGVEISKVVPGYISTEVDARLSFDTAGSLLRARRIIQLYEQAGVGKERVLIKLASTWECIAAAEELEREGIRCNLTLLFSFEQAVACANAKVTLISPFVGRIYDWHKAKSGGKEYDPPSTDPGVLSVLKIYNYFRATGSTTIVMGASFRNVDQILELAGCDRLTISPALLDKLAGMEAPVPVKLTPAGALLAHGGAPIPPQPITPADLKFSCCFDPMTCDKLNEGIRNFSADLVKLENEILAPLLSA